MERLDLSFRKYSPDDLSRCAEIAQNAWPTGDWLAEGKGKTELMSSYVELSLRNSNWAEVAVESGKVVGLLFGEIYPKKGKSFGLRSIMAEFTAVMKALTGQYGKVDSKWMMIWRFMLTDFKLALRMPRSDAYVGLFVVDADYRGKGIGRRMMERFIVEAGDAKAETIAVYTDDVSSNYQFYENFGFKKVGSFVDTGSTFYNRKKTNGLIYVLRLGGAKHYQNVTGS